MSKKKRTSISIDEDVYQYLQQSDVNGSGLINELVREYKSSDDRQVAALKLQYEQLINDAKELEERAQRKRDNAADVKQLLEDARGQEDELLIEARAALKFSPDDPDDPAVQKWAEKVGVEPTELLDLLDSNNV